VKLDARRTSRIELRAPGYRRWRRRIRPVQNLRLIYDVKLVKYDKRKRRRKRRRR